MYEYNHIKHNLWDLKPCSIASKVRDLNIKSKLYSLTRLYYSTVSLGTAEETSEIILNITEK